MSAEPRSFRIVREPGGFRDQIASSARDWQLPASGYCLAQAEELLREIGYVRQDDGTWQPPE